MSASIEDIIDQEEVGGARQRPNERERDITIDIYRDTSSLPERDQAREKEKGEIEAEGCAYIYIYMYVCMYVCMYVYIYIYTHSCAPVHLHAKR